MTRFDPKNFFAGAANVALVAAAKELFGLLSRELDLPGSWSALVRRTAGDDILCPPGGCVDGEDADDILFARATPLELAFEIPKSISKDGHDVTGELVLRVRIAAERSDLHSFRSEVVAGRRVVTLDDLHEHLAPGVRAAAAELIGAKGAQSLVDPARFDDHAAELAKSLAPLCFPAGLNIDRVVRLALRSSSLDRTLDYEKRESHRERRRQSEQHAREALAKARRQRVGEAAALLEKLGSLAGESPNTSILDLARGFDQRERGAIYEALIAGGTSERVTDSIIVATSEEILRYELGAYEAPAQRIPVPTSAGPVRSVRAGRPPCGSRALLVGCARGVHVFPVRGASQGGSESEATIPGDIRTFHWPGEREVRGGFNAVAIAPSEGVRQDQEAAESTERGTGSASAGPGTHIVATHSELGIVSWKLGSGSAEESAEPEALFPALTCEASRVRGVCSLGSSMFASIDDYIIEWPAAAPGGAPTRIYPAGSTVTAFHVSDFGLLVGTAGGSILRFDLGDPASAAYVVNAPGGSARPIGAVQLADCGGIPLLAYANGSLAAHVGVLEESVLQRYESAGQPVAQVDLAADLLTALTEVRDRIIVWNLGTPTPPASVLLLRPLTGRSIQDVCLLPVGS